MMKHKPITEGEFQVEKWAGFIEILIYDKPSDMSIKSILREELAIFRDAVIRNHNKTLRNKGLLTNEVTKDE